METQDNNKTAYVQCDWVACKGSGDQYNPVIAAQYEDLLKQLSTAGITNIASWSKSKTQGSLETVKTLHAVRNTSEVDEADMVITMLLRKDPPYKHWGSIAVISYALGKGKPCYIIAEDDCVVWTNHMIRHPSIRRFQNISELVAGVTL